LLREFKFNLLIILVVDFENVDHDARSIQQPVEVSEDNTAASAVEENDFSVHPRFESPLRIRHHVKSAVDYIFKPSGEDKSNENLVLEESREHDSKESSDAAEVNNAVQTVNLTPSTEPVEEHLSRVHVPLSEPVKDPSENPEHLILTGGSSKDETKEVSQEDFSLGISPSEDVKEIAVAKEAIMVDEMLMTAEDNSTRSIIGDYIRTEEAPNSLVNFEPTLSLSKVSEIIYSTDDRSLQVEDLSVTKSDENLTYDIDVAPLEDVDEVVEVEQTTIVTEMSLSSMEEVSHEDSTVDTETKEKVAEISPQKTAEEIYITEEKENAHEILAANVQDIKRALDLNSTTDTLTGDEVHNEETPISPSKSSFSESLFEMKRHVPTTFNQIFKSEKTPSTFETENQSTQIIGIAMKSGSMSTIGVDKVISADESVMADAKDLNTTEAVGVNEIVKVISNLHEVPIVEQVVNENPGNLLISERVFN
jgi:hypothetical protein